MCCHGSVCLFVYKTFVSCISNLFIGVPMFLGVGRRERHRRRRRRAHRTPIPEEGGAAARLHTVVQRQRDSHIDRLQAALRRPRATEGWRLLADIALVPVDGRRVGLEALRGTRRQGAYGVRCDAAAVATELFSFIYAML